MRISVKDYLRIENDDVETLSAKLMEGPVGIGIEVNENFIFYKSGVLPIQKDCDNGINHAVLLVG